MPPTTLTPVPSGVTVPAPPAPPAPPDEQDGPTHLLVRPWIDPVLDEVGHDPRSPYVERFWLSSLGPSSTV